MPKIEPLLRGIIARNIRECRREKFPGRGGGKKCAEEFSQYSGKNISPQQWSPWESGGRTPNEESLQQIARFFGKTLEYMHSDNHPSAPIPRYEPVDESYADMSAPELIIFMGRSRMKAVYQVEISVVSVKFVPRNKPPDQ